MDFRLERGQRCAIWMDGQEAEAVKIAAANLVNDLERALGVTAEILLQDAGDVTEGSHREKNTEGSNQQEGSRIDCSEINCGEKEEGTKIPEIFIRTWKESDVSGAADVFGETVDVSGLYDGMGTLRKEAYLHKVSSGRLTIVGSGRRGTVYGIYDFCEAIGVSPWYFWADVPVQKRIEFVLPENYKKVDFPSVEYRGIFINDEEELEAWVQNYMGEPTIGVKTYEKVFELLLRLKANYIWPAMHVNSFNLKPENGALADRMGIVVGTSHCDMLMRSNNREWKPWIQKKGYTDAAYDYSIEGKNREILREYWRESVEQNRDFEVCYTLGMRGIHDSGFETKGLAGKTENEIRKAKIELLEKIISDQRKILKSTQKGDAMMTFIPYKEVLELYDHGLDVPEDMTLVWANDNYGYIRRYPSEKEKRRRGGNGIYYHNSYWAPPSMSYVFLCSIPLAHTRNELAKAWEEGIRKLWVLNCGAIKPLEQEITFFLRLAWEIGKPGAQTEDVEAFVTEWVNRTFSGKIGKQVAELLCDFSQLTNVRKIENMDYDAFSQTAYGDEAAMRIHRYEELFAKGNMLYKKLPDEEKGAFFQMVLMRVHAAYFTNLAFYYGDRSTLMYGRENMQAAAFYTEKSREAEDARRRLLHYYNHVMCGGKWKGILDPEGFPPPRTAMMPVCTPPFKIEGAPAMRVDVWNGEEELCFASPGEKWIEIGNTGSGEFEVEVQAPEWVTLSKKQVVVRTEGRILVRVTDVSCDREGEIVVKGTDSQHSLLRIPVKVLSKYAKEGCAVEEDGLIVLEGDAFQDKDMQMDHSAPGDFKRIRRLGRMQGNLMEACVQREVEDMKTSLPGAKPLCYCFAAQNAGEFLLEIHRFPSLNSVGRLRIGISLDGESIHIVESFSNDEWRGNWKKNVLDNVDRLYLKLPVKKAGIHRLTVWAVDQYFAFSRMVLYTMPRKENNLAGIRGTQPLPAEWGMETWCGSFYGEYELPPRPVFYAPLENNRDGIAVTCRVAPHKLEGKVMPDWYLEKGRHIFEEKKGEIWMDAASALAGSECAWLSSGGDNGLWCHCGSESFTRSGLAMYIRKPGLRWKVQNAPSLNFRIRCKGGSYTLWMLSKLNLWEEGFFGIGVDGEAIPQNKLYANGSLWRYEAEQIYRFVPATQIQLTKGEHTIQIFALASGMRYDRFCLKGQNKTDGECYPEV